MSKTIPTNQNDITERAEKTSLVDADQFLISDSADNSILKRVQKSNVIPVASETVAGIVERATDAEASAGTDTERFITPAQLSANGGGWNLISSDTISGSNTLGQASDTSIIPANTKFIVFQCASYSFLSGSYLDQTLGNIILFKDVQSSSYLTTGSNGSSSATDIKGVKISYSGSTLTCQTLGFTLGLNREARIIGTVYYFS